MILMGDPLAPLPGLVRLARETVRIIRQNILLFAFLFNLSGIALTAWIMPTWSEAWMARSPVAAALFHQLGSLLVLLNAMRLLWFERWHQRWPGRLETAIGDLCGRWLAQLRPIRDAASWGWRFRGQGLRVALYLLLAAYLTQVVVFVQPEEVAIVKRFGRWHAVLEPGPHLRLPPPWDTILRERPSQVRTVEIGLRRYADGTAATSAPIEWGTPHEQRQADEAVMLTGDQSLVELAATIQYRLSDVRAYRFGVRDPDRILTTMAESVTREVMAAQPLLTDNSDGRQLAEILTDGRVELEHEIRERLQARADRLGLGIELLPRGVCLQEIHPPLAVVSAFRDVSSAFKEMERLENEAEAYYRDRVIKAAGEAAYRELASAGAQIDDALWTRLDTQLAGEASAEIHAARGFAEEKQQQAVGEAERFALVETAHGSAPQLTEWRMFLETLSQAFPGKKKLILGGKGGGRRHLLLGLRQNAAGPLVPLLEEGSSEEQ
jgi:Cu+-exporting ATPase